MVTYPEDWKEFRFKDTGIEVSKGQVITRADVRIGEIPVIAGGMEPAYYCDKYNRDGFTVTISASGANAGYVNLYKGKIFASDCSTISEAPNYDVRYIYYLLLNKQNEIYDAQTGGAQPHIHPNDIYKLPIVYTSNISEQQAIASALSDFDEHIDNLSDLIEKKKAIRDGALEDLVSGRTRLDGFNGEWINVKLSDFAQINPSSALPEVFKYVDLESVKGITLMGWRVERKETAPSRAKRLAQFGDIFFQTVRPYQRNNYLFELSDEDVVFSTGYAQLRTKNDARFLFLLLRQDDFVNEVLDNCTGTSYPAINPSKLSDIKIYVPIDKNEQQAIAEVLTAMDEEIESLKIEKEKMIQIKEGAMDDLLTGRVRLKV
ncbi:MAG: restriction endonuclease subunit S [Phascolarctobacterium faecium]|uniref:restriction endonuclease subunit S n=1 Tax=Phascolarctobacterium faecium TaxID=33025 RepID=UPI00399B1164